MHSHHSASALAALIAIGLMAGTATAAPVKKANMPPFCRGEAAETFKTKQAYVKTGKLVRAKDGNQLLKGTVDLRMQGTKKFECRFDAKGNFIDVKALPSEGK